MRNDWEMSTGVLAEVLAGKLIQKFSLPSAYCPTVGYLKTGVSNIPANQQAPTDQEVAVGASCQLTATAPHVEASNRLPLDA